MFGSLETAAPGTEVDMATLLAAVRFDRDGLVPAIAQDAASGEVLMLAWMNRTALEETLHSGRVCYWSRSRQRLWRKGEESGNVQHLESLHFDCDGDTVLMRVRQQGPACHTGRTSCFYVRVGPDAARVDRPVEVDPAELYRR